MNWIITPDKYLTSDDTKQLRNTCRHISDDVHLVQMAFIPLYSLENCSLLAITISQLAGVPYISGGFSKNKTFCRIKCAA